MHNFESQTTYRNLEMSKDIKELLLIKNASPEKILLLLLRIVK
jgi:hypothetical protein